MGSSTHAKHPVRRATFQGLGSQQQHPLSLLKLSNHLGDNTEAHSDAQIPNMADREQPVTLRTRKFIRNALLGRKQMVVYVSLLLQPHSPNPSPPFHYHSHPNPKLIQRPYPATSSTPIAPTSPKTNSATNSPNSIKREKTKSPASASEHNMVAGRVPALR